MLTEAELVEEVRKATIRELRELTGKHCTVVIIGLGGDEDRIMPQELLDAITETLEMPERIYEHRSRLRPYVELRQICSVYLMRFYPRMTLKQAGTLLGGWDHTSIIHFKTRHWEQLETDDEDYKQKVNKVEKALAKWERKVLSE